MADENQSHPQLYPDALATYEQRGRQDTTFMALFDDATGHNEEKVTLEDIKWSIEFVANLVTPYLF